MEIWKKALLASLAFLTVMCLSGCSLSEQTNNETVRKLNECATIYESYVDTGLSKAHTKEFEDILVKTEGVFEVFDNYCSVSNFKSIVKHTQRRYNCKTETATNLCKYELYGLRIIALLKLNRENEFIDEFSVFYNSSSNIHIYNFEYNTLLKEKGFLDDDELSLLFMAYDNLLDNTLDPNTRVQIAVSARESCIVLGINTPEKYIDIVKNR